MRVRLPLLAVLLVTACEAPSPTGPVPSPTPTPSATLTAGALRLPSVAAAECPTTRPQDWSGPGVASRVLGDGPVHPVADYFQDGTVLLLRDQDRRPDGTWEVKVRWIGADYTGPVLVRAGRIDQPGTARVRFSYRGEERDGGYYADLDLPVSDLPATTTVGGPGCYAYQVDGTTFTTTIVFRAALST